MEWKRTVKADGEGESCRFICIDGMSIEPKFTSFIPVGARVTVRRIIGLTFGVKAEGLAEETWQL